MRKIVVTWAVVASVLAGFAEPLRAQDDGSGFEAGLRLGYGIPLGDVTGDGGKLSDGIEGMVPLWLDLGYRVNPNIFVGLYTHYGIGIPGNAIGACDLVDCSASDVRLGLQMHYHFMPGDAADFWLGPGVGYEWMTLGASAAGQSFSTTAHGFEFLNVQAGVDFDPARHWFVGPFLSFSLGQYGDVSVDCSGPVDCSMIGDVSGEIPSKSLHEWLVLGVRGGYEP